MNASDYSFNESQKGGISSKKARKTTNRCLSHNLCSLYHNMKIFEDCSYMFLISIQLGFFLFHLFISWISDAWLEAIGNIIVIFLTVILSLIFYSKLST